MDDVTKLVTAIFGGILTLAIISVIISRKSRAPEAIQSFSSGLANVVAAAVNPQAVNATNGANNGNNSFSNPNPINQLSSAFNQVKSFGSQVQSAVSTVGSIFG